MKKFVLAVTLILTFSSLPAFSASTPKPGSLCSKQGITKTYKGKKYTCIKSGKKLVWNKGVAVQTAAPQVTPTPTTSPNPTPTPTPTASPSPTLSPTPTTSPSPLPSSSPSIRKTTEGDVCSTGDSDVIGNSKSGLLVVLMCGQKSLKYIPRPNSSKIDPNTGQRVSIPNLGIPNLTNYIPAPASTSSPEIEITNINQLTNVNSCKLENAGHNGHFAVGFPMWAERAKLQGKLKVAIVPVDFPDLQDQGNPLIHFKNVLDLTKIYFERTANNQATIEYVSPEKYIRMPRAIMDYGLSGDLFTGSFNGEPYWNYVREALRVTDPVIDFTGVSVVIVVTPPATTKAMIGTFVAQASERGQQNVMSTAEGSIYNYMIRGNGKYPEDLWGWVHEFGHMLGLSDLRNVLNPANQNSSDLGFFDLMNSSVLPELLFWERFTLGILQDDQVRCVTDSKVTTHWISPIEEMSNRPKGVVIPLSRTKAVVIESRRRLGFDNRMKDETQGVLVYTVDTTIKYGLSPITIVPRNGSKDLTWRTDATLQLEDSLVIEGWKIEVIESGEFGDVIKVERTT